MHDHKPTCATHGHGHRTTRAEALDAWEHARPPVAASVLRVDDDGLVVVRHPGGELLGWHHDGSHLRRALATGKEVGYQSDVRLLHVGGPFQALGPWAFSLGDVLDHTECGRPSPAAAPAPRPRRARIDREPFTVPFGAAGGHRPLVGALARLLDRLEAEPVRQALIVSIVGPNLFTQALVGAAEGAWLEAVSNTFIDEPGLRLGDAQHRLLEVFGYRPPSATVPNHHQPIDRPATFTEVAELLVAPLEAVYGLGDGDQVRVDTFPAPSR